MSKGIENTTTFTFESDDEIIPQFLRLMEGAKINTILTSTKMVPLLRDALGLGLQHKHLKVRSIDLVTLYDTKELKIYRGGHISSREFVLIRTNEDGTQNQYTFKKEG